MNSKDLYLRLLGYVKPYWKAFLASIFSTILVAATEPAFPALLKPLLDGSFINKDPTWMKLVPILMVGIFLVRGITTFISSYSMSWVANKVVFDLRGDMFKRLVNLPTSYFENNSSGALISKVSYDVSQVTSAATSALTVLVRDSLTIIGLLAWLIYLNWKLSLIALAVTPAILLSITLFSKRLREMSRGTQRANGEVIHVLEESIECHKVVKIFGGQEYESKRFSQVSNALRSFNMKQTVAASATVPLVQIFAAIALAIIVYIATLQSAQNETTVGGFVSFLTAMLMLLSPLKRLTGINESMQRGLAAAESVFAMIDEKPETDSGSINIGHARGDLEFRDVSFTYPNTEREALSHISLNVKHGEIIALVGASGSGKTTLVNLIPRFHQPTGGVILLDGHDLRTIKLAHLRDNVALVSQDVVLFNDTIAANIAYGKQSQATEAEIVAAAKAAHAMEFIHEMPDGLQTMIGENGVRLSGGQRQRLAIARALLKNAAVLILDEATSALDSKSERHIQAALETLMKNRTTFVIAHRLSTIENADRIIVMQKGRIIESGRHDDLLAAEGVYANLYRIQYASEAEAK